MGISWIRLQTWKRHRIPMSRDGHGPGCVALKCPRVIYCFGEFTLDVRTRRLLRNEQEVHVSPKAFDLLVMLIENRGQAMPKADLQQRLWPSTYVLETNIAGLVAEIRHVLEDPADDPRYIRTMHRFGYWFVGAVCVDRRRSDSARLGGRDVQNPAARGVYGDGSSLAGTGSKPPNPPNPEPKRQLRPVASMRARCAPLFPEIVATHNAYSSLFCV